VLWRLVTQNVVLGAVLSIVWLGVSFWVLTCPVGWPDRKQVARVHIERAQITALREALRAYRADTGSYPTTRQGLDALFTRPTLAPRPRRWRGPYRTDSAEAPDDPWGRPFRYSPLIEHGYAIECLGMDGVKGGVGANADLRSTDTTGP
jgi:general secretion pathway protein G